MIEEKAIAVAGGATATAVVGFRIITGRWPWEAPSKGVLRVTDVSVDPKPVPLGEPFSIRATVENLSQAEATAIIVFTVEGGEIDSEEITLLPGAKDTVSTRFSIEKAGDYRICAEAEPKPSR